MAIFFRDKSSFFSRLKSLRSSQVSEFRLQRSNHILTQESPSYPRMVVLSDSEAQKSPEIDMSQWKKLNANLAGVKRSMIPQAAWLVLSILRDKGFETYLVGGCVRDLLLNRVPKDFDVITTAKLEQVRSEFRRCQIVGRRFPICQVRMKGSVIEVSSFETVAKHSEEKEEVLSSRSPGGCGGKDYVRWKNSMHRDFTINSLFFDPFKNRIFDYVNGLADLSSLKLRTVIPAHLSFQEDCARILRGLRIAGRLGLSISKETASAMLKLSSSVKSLDKIRLMMELNYMLSYGAAESTIYLLQRFNLLEHFFPFQAAYINQQSGEKSPQGSLMLMKLFSNLDTLVNCDRPCDCSLWVGLLAFHHALVTNPQDAFVIWAFASVLYHENWKEGVEFAKENAKMPVNFAPEISGFSGFKSIEELAKEVGHLAGLIQDSVGTLMDAKILAQSMSRCGVSLDSGLVFVTKRIGTKVAQLFDVLVNDVDSYKFVSKSFIDYHALGKGHQHETRFVLGKIILETLSSGLTKGAEIAEEGPKVIEKKHGSRLSDLVKDHIVERKCTIPIMSAIEREQEPVAGKKRKLAKLVATEKEQVVLRDESQATSVPKEKPSMTRRNALQKKTHQLHEKSMTSNVSVAKKVEHEEKKDARMQFQEVVKEMTENSKQTLGMNKTGQSSLVSLFKDHRILLQEVVKEKTENSEQALVKKKTSRPSLASLFKS